jgi:type II secretory pathway pseudopilin PulG
MFRKITENKTGMTMVELMMAVTIILLVVVPLTKVLFKSMQGAMSFGDANKAVQLAQDLMEEIKQKKWDENEPPGGGQTLEASYSAIGNDAGESAPAVAAAKLTWDDIDDYNGLREFPARDSANNVIPSAMVGNTPRFKRAVIVRYVTIPDTNPATVVPLGAGTTHYKEIIISVDWEGRLTGSPISISSVRANVRRY